MTRYLFVVLFSLTLSLAALPSSAKGEKGTEGINNNPSVPFYF